jgi:uncharacterized protein YecT (DUF1311 family)
MKKILLLLTLTFTLLFPASFDCKKAKTDVEKMICSNEELSQLDEELNEVYKEIIVIDREEIKIQQTWLKDRDICSTLFVEQDKNSNKIKYECLELDFYTPRIIDIRVKLRTYKDRLQQVRQQPNHLTYGDVLDDKNIPFLKSTNRDLFSKVRPANNFQLMGGIKNPICKETIALFNEKGTYSQVDSNFDKLFWYLDNSGLIEWNSMDKQKVEHYHDAHSHKIFKFGVEYVEIDIDGDGVNEYAYRQGGMVSSMYIQEIHIFDRQMPDGNITSLLKECQRRVSNCNNDTSILRYVILPDPYYPTKWVSVGDYNAIYNISVGNKSMRILYPKIIGNSTRNIGLNSPSFWNLYKLKSSTVAVSAEKSNNDMIPEFLVFSLHRDKLAALECIIVPKEW